MATAVLRRMRVLHLMGAAISKPLAQTEATTAMAVLRRTSTPERPWSYILLSQFSSSSAALVGGGGGGGGAPGVPGGCGGGGGASPAGGAASAPAPGGGAPAAGLVEKCYTVGQHGVLSFDRRFFVPLDTFMSQVPVFDDVPQDRLISPVDPDCPYFTSETAKEWIRSGFLSVISAHDLGIVVDGAFLDGNVGVIKGTNLLVFLNLYWATAKTQTEVSERTGKHQFTVAGFATYLEEKLAQLGKQVPDGLEDLIEYAKIAHPNEFHLIKYSPEFLNLHGKYILFMEVHRILRVQMPVQNEHSLAYNAILRIDNRLMMKKKNQSVTNDVILSNWMEHYKRSAPKGLKGMKGVLNLNVQPKSVLDLSKLSPLEHLELVRLVTKVYIAPPAAATTAKLPPLKPTPVTSCGKPIPALPIEARLIELPRHAMAHIVEESTMSLVENLPAINQASIHKNPLVWQDGVMLLDHRIAGYLGVCAETFNVYNIWGRLCLESLLPVPKIHCLPSNVKQE